MKLYRKEDIDLIIRRTIKEWASFNEQSEPDHSLLVESYMNNDIIYSGGIYIPVEEMLETSTHNIPFYAYGDNEAACDMAERLIKINNLLFEIIKKNENKR